jgi:hypothetical protein
MRYKIKIDWVQKEEYCFLTHELFEFAENNLKTSRSHACKRRMFRYAEEIPRANKRNFGFYFGTGKPSQNSCMTVT